MNRTDRWLSYILLSGLTISLLFITIGTILFFLKNDHQPINQMMYSSNPNHLNTIYRILDHARQWDALAIIQLGILILIITPLMRVLTCLWIFLIEKDYLYIFLACIVLSILLYSVI